MPISDSSILAAKILCQKYGQMGIQLYDNWVQNIVVKGEIAFYEQFLLFPLGFQKLSHSLLLMLQNEYLWSKGLNYWAVLAKYPSNGVHLDVGAHLLFRK